MLANTDPSKLSAPGAPTPTAAAAAAAAAVAAAAAAAVAAPGAVAAAAGTVEENLGKLLKLPRMGS
jgi:hypothetical protein